MQRIELKNRLGIVKQIHQYFEHNEEAKYIHRLHGLLLFASKDDESCDSIGALFGNSPRTVSNWIKKVNKTGDLESLRSKPQIGRPPRLSVEQEAAIKVALQNAPEKSGISTKIWDGKSLSWYIYETYGITLKVRACQNLFHKLGFSLKRARPTVARGEENKTKCNSQ